MILNFMRFFICSTDIDIMKKHKKMGYIIDGVYEKYNEMICCYEGSSYDSYLNGFIAPSYCKLLPMWNFNNQDDNIYQLELLLYNINRINASLHVHCQKPKNKQRL